MRMHIWKKTDYLGRPEDRWNLDVDGVKFEEEIPLCYHFKHDIPPIGKLTNIEVVDGEILADVEFFDNGQDAVFFLGLVLDEGGYLCYYAHITGELILRYRLGIYANNIVQKTHEDGSRTVTNCMIREVSLIPEEAWPLCEPNADRTGGANPGAHITKPEE
jgi:hypothetical protein